MAQRARTKDSGTTAGRSERDSQVPPREVEKRRSPPGPPAPDARKTAEECGDRSPPRISQRRDIESGRRVPRSSTIAVITTRRTGRSAGQPSRRCQSSSGLSGPDQHVGRSGSRAPWRGCPPRRRSSGRPHRRSACFLPLSAILSLRASARPFGCSRLRYARVLNRLATPAARWRSDDRATTVRADGPRERGDAVRSRRAGPGQPGRGGPHAGAAASPRHQPHRHRGALRGLGASHRAVDGPTPEGLLSRDQDRAAHRPGGAGGSFIGRSSGCGSTAST